MKLLEQAKKLPLGPGVYFFISKKGEILYIGRATSLRRRVSSYFQKRIDPRLDELINQTAKIKHKKTETILESFFEEANLIKKHWPKYNVRDRDDRSFIYIVIPKSQYPYPIMVRQRELKKFLPQAHVFGPYQSFSLVKTALKIIRRIFPYSTCRPFSGQPCFNYQIGLCPGLCVGEISKKEYQKNINNIILLLRGQKKRLIKKLEKENPQQAESLKHIQDVALISREETTDSLNRIEGYDISHLAGQETFGAMVVFKGGRADNSQYRLFRIKEAPRNDDLAALKEVISRRLNHREWPLPDLMVIDGGRPQISYLFKNLKNKFSSIPIIGISKLAGDKLVFPPNVKKSSKELAQSMKNTLLEVRNEAHRFALKSSRRQRKIK